MTSRHSDFVSYDALPTCPACPGHSPGELASSACPGRACPELVEGSRGVHRMVEGCSLRHARTYTKPYILTSNCALKCFVGGLLLNAALTSPSMLLHL